MLSNSLQLAVEHGLETIAFPNISTGVYRFPKDLAARIALEEVTHFLSQNKHLKKSSSSASTKKTTPLCSSGPRLFYIVLNRFI